MLCAELEYNMTIELHLKCNSKDDLHNLYFDIIFRTVQAFVTGIDGYAWAYLVFLKLPVVCTSFVLAVRH